MLEHISTERDINLNPQKLIFNLPQIKKIAIVFSLSFFVYLIY